MTDKLDELLDKYFAAIDRDYGVDALDAARATIRAEFEKVKEQRLIMLLAEKAFPGIDVETVKLFSVKDASTIVIHPEVEGESIETVQLEKYGLVVTFGYGPKSNALVVRGETFEKMPKSWRTV